MKTRILIAAILLSLPSSAFSAGDWFFSTNGCWIATADSDVLLSNSFPKTNETVTWSGGQKGGKAHGQGTTQWFSNGKPTTTYSGGMALGYRHRHGICSSEDGTTEANWVNGKCDGELTMNAANGWQYQDSYTNGELTGSALITFPNGHTYSGEVKQVKQHGLGREELEGGFVYEGEFSQGKFHGKGVTIYPNGTRLEGMYRNSELIGVGLLKLTNGTTQKVVSENGTMRWLEP